MRNIGIAILAVGFALLLFVLYNFVRDSSRTVSPIPQDGGVKVLFITPPK